MGFNHAHSEKSKERMRGYRKKNVCISQIHSRIRSIKPQPDSCEHCNTPTKTLDLASNNGHYYTSNPDDYSYLCKSCHKKLDLGLICLHL